MQNKKYGEYGGQYVAESLMSVLAELETAYNEAINDPKFIEEYNYYLKEYVGRETPLYFAEKLSKKYGTKIYLKREDLNHTGAHKINNVIGQILLAKRMGKKKVIAETGAGQHGVATATGAALFDMECTYRIYGRRRYGTPGIKRIPYGNAWNKGRMCKEWKPYFKRCHKRGNSYMGEKCRRYFLYYRFCGRPSSISTDGKGIPESYQRRDKETDS